MNFTRCQVSLVKAVLSVESIVSPHDMSQSVSRYKEMGYFYVFVSHLCDISGITYLCSSCFENLSLNRDS